MCIACKTVVLGGQKRVLDVLKLVWWMLVSIYPLQAQQVLRTAVPSLQLFVSCVFVFAESSYVTPA